MTREQAGRLLSYYKRTLIEGGLITLQFAAPKKRVWPHGSSYKGAHGRPCPLTNAYVGTASVRSGGMKHCQAGSEEDTKHTDRLDARPNRAPPDTQARLLHSTASGGSFLL